MARELRRDGIGWLDATGMGGWYARMQLFPVNIVRLIAMIGCRRSEIINLLWKDVDSDHSCLRLSQSKERFSVHPIGLPVVEFLDSERPLPMAAMFFRVGAMTMPLAVSSTNGMQSSKAHRLTG